MTNSPPEVAGEALSEIAHKAALAAEMCDNEGRAEGFRIIESIARKALASTAAKADAEGDARDAARYRRLKEWFASANFYPEDMDLGPCVALIFVAPAGLEVSADLDATIDSAASPKTNGGMGS